MRYTKKTDAIVNILSPLLFGSFLYVIPPLNFPTFIKSYLPDGLWAYSFISCILIIWDRKINWFWILAGFCISICFEMLQYYHVLSGTGDIYDIIVYLFFFIIALKLNFSFEALLIKPQNNERN
jgi:hypothetical protein